jgi:hypothetical protein
MFLLSRPGRLNHLIDRAIAPAEKPLAEAKREIEHNFRLLIRPQLPVVTMRRNETALTHE